MALITIPNTFSAGAVIVASQHNANFSTISTDYNGNIDNNNISASAAITYSKLNLASSIVNADVNASAGIVGSKLNLTTPGIIGSGTPAAGTFTTLTGTDIVANTTLKLGTPHQGDILYDNGTSLVRLTPGTSGQALLTGGAAANPSWGTAGALTLVSVTTMSAATASSNIAIDKTKRYLVDIIQTASTNGGGAYETSLTFNGDTANNYGSTQKGGNLTINDPRIGLYTVNSPTDTESNLDITFNIYPQGTTTTKRVFLIGTHLGTASLTINTAFSGVWAGSADVTYFQIVSDGLSTITAKIYLYSYAQA